MFSPKTVPLLIFIIISLVSCKNFSEEKIVDFPKNWTSKSEAFSDIIIKDTKIKGKKHIGFLPGWDNVDGDNYLTFFTFIDTETSIDKSISEIEKFMEAYLQEHFQSTFHKYDSSKNNLKTKSFFEEISPNLFVGQVLISNSTTENKDIALNVLFEHLLCGDLDKNIYTLKISPKKVNNPVWNLFDRAQIMLPCGSE